MATYAERAQLIGDGLVANPPATQAQINRLGQGMAASEGMEAEYNAMGGGQKAEYFVKFALRYFRGLVSRRDQGVAYSTHVGPVDDAVMAEFPDQ